MAIKKPLPLSDAPDRSHVFNWGLKVSGFSELLILTGQIDADQRRKRPTSQATQ